MPRKIFTTLFLLFAAVAVASPAAARARSEKPKIKSDLIKSDLDYSPRSEPSPFEDDPMLEAIEIATLSAHKHSHRHCWRAVKDALFEANVVPFRPTSKYAWQAGEELEQKFSFKKLEVTDPFEAPVGSILVYGGPGAGHVEFRTGDGFVSDFANPRPSHRPLIGVYVASAAVSKGIRE